MELFKDTHLVKLELLSNATTIDSALNYIKNKQEQQERRLEQRDPHKRLALDSSNNDNDDNHNNSISEEHSLNKETSGRQTVF